MPATVLYICYVADTESQREGHTTLFTRSRFNVGPPSATLAQYWTDFGWKTRTSSSSSSNILLVVVYSLRKVEDSQKTLKSRFHDNLPQVDVTSDTSATIK